MLCLLLPEWHLLAANQRFVTCDRGPGGEYLRADGYSNQPWSVKVSGQPVVYVERCLMDQLLSFFPDAVRERRFVGSARASARAVQQPAAWRAANGETILTLSPDSRFQVAAALMWVESQFHPNVSPSTAGAIGVMQVMPGTGDQMGLPRVDNPMVNLQAGLKYLLYIEEQIARHCPIQDRSKESSARYRDLLAASYNAGPNYLSMPDEAGVKCRLEAFPEFSRTEYLSRFRRAMGYRFLPAYLNYDPDGRLLRR